MLHLPTKCPRNPGRWAFSMIEVMVAIAILAIFVSLTPTPGYKPDHMQ